MHAQNLNVASVLEELAFLLEISGANFFKVRAYKNAAQTIKGLEKPLFDALDLSDVKGIGSGISAIASDVLSGKKPQELIDLRAKIPRGLFDIAKLPGLGPKRLKTLWENNITDLAHLENLAAQQKLRKLPGFGSALESGIREDIRIFEKFRGLYLGGEALALAQALIRKILKDPRKNLLRVHITGDLRRYVPLVTCIELVGQKGPHFDEKEFFNYLRPLDFDYQESTAEMSYAGFPVKMHFSAESDFGTILLKTTGPKAFCDEFQNLDAFGEEKEAFSSNGFNYVPSELRQSPKAKSLLVSKKPRLIKLGDIQGDLHIHSQYSDGTLTIEEMALEAGRLGYEYIAITDHSQSLTVANGLDEVRLLKQAKEIENLNANDVVETWIFKGIEVDILKGGDLDLPDKSLKALDFVVASVHSAFQMPKEEMTERIIAAMNNPYVHAIGHISGRLLGKRPGYEIDWERIFSAAKKTGTALELNASPERLDLPEEFLERVAEYGIKIIISTDAHSKAGFQNMLWGVMTSRRAFLKKEQVLNTLSLDGIKKWLKDAKKV